MEGERQISDLRLLALPPDILPAFSGISLSTPMESSKLSHVPGNDQDWSSNYGNDQRGNVHRAVYATCDAFQGIKNQAWQFILIPVGRWSMHSIQLLKDYER